MNVIIRRATKEDLIQIIRILAGDKLGKLREDLGSDISDKYYKAFEKIDNDSSQMLVVAENESKEIVGTMQLSFIQYLSYRGGLRAQAETVFVREDCRGKGVGRRLMMFAADTAKQKGAHLIQLTTDKQRPEALRFYEKLGYKATHEGMKLHFNSASDNENPTHSSTA